MRPRPGARKQSRTSAARKPALWLRGWRLALICVGLGLVLIPALASVAIDWRLRQGPLEADFLIGRIEAAMTEKLAPLRVHLGAAALRYGDAESNGLGLLLADIRLSQADGSQVAEIPHADIDLDASGLLVGKVVPTRLTLSQPHLRLHVVAGHGLQLHADVPPSPTGVQTSGKPARLAVSTNTGAPVTDAAETAKPPAPSGDVLALLRGVMDTHGGAGLTELHIRDAAINFGDPGHDSLWRVPLFDLRLKAGAEGAVLAGAGNAIAPGGPLHLTLSAEQQDPASDLKLTLAVDHLVPADLAELSPPLRPLAPALLPVGGEASMVFPADGSLSQLDMKIGLGKGHYDVGGACAESFRLDQGGLHIRYVRGTGKVELLPSHFANNGSTASVSGLALVGKDPDGRERWQYDLELSDVQLADKRHGLAPLAIDNWTAHGTFTPSTGEAVLDRLALQAGGARLVMGGRFLNGGLETEARVEDADPGLVLRLWPACLQTYARDWVLNNLKSGRIAKGHMRMALDAAALKLLRTTGRTPEGSASAEFSVDDIKFTYADDLPPVIATHGEVSFSGSRLLAQMADAASQMPSGRVLTLTNSRYEIADFLDPSPRGRVTVEAAGPIETGLEYLNLKPLNLVAGSGLRVTDFSGDFTGQLELELPATRAPQPGDLALKAKATLTALKLKHPLGGYTVQGGTVDLEVNESSLRADGDLLVNGVSAKVLWSRSLGQPGVPVPPIRITATLDANDREQLGIYVNHMLAGDLPVTVDLAAGDDGSGRIAHVEGNLAGAELVVDTLAWHKPQGDPATVEFDLVPGDKGHTRLENFRLVGDKVAIRGDVELGPDHKLTAFKFPEFSVNVVTQLSVTGDVRPDKVLAVTAKGRFFDGRDFFRSLFTVGQLGTPPLPPSKSTTGLDLTADIDTILGYSQVSLHHVHLHAIRQQGVLSALSGSGQLDGGHKVGIGMEHQAGQPRYLEADTDDAGRAFKLINLYQGLDGGYAALQVNLDGQGSAEKIGTLWAKHFTLQGDPVVKEVLNDAAPPGKAGKNPSQRAQFDFDRMRVQFLVGEGQLVLRDMLINGPLLGATLRGRIDYGRQTLQLGGTYIPLYGLNSVFGALPIFGQLLVGRSGEGLLGITFAVDGPLSNPEVVVNPVSVVAPGILRQIFEIGPKASAIEPATEQPLIIGAPDAGPDVGQPFPPMTADTFDQDGAATAATQPQ